MKRTALLAALLALSLTACGEKPAAEAPVAPVSAPAAETAPTAEVVPAVETAPAPEAMDSMKK